MVGMTGCTRDLSSDSYTDDAAGEVSETHEGNVIKVRTVTVKNADKLTGNTAGLLIGGLTGGIIGNQFGGGSGKLATTAGGALLGAGAGALAQDALSKQKAHEYTVRLIDGRLKTVVQGTDTHIAPGTRVLLYVYHNGRSRIVPF